MHPVHLFRKDLDCAGTTGLYVLVERLLYISLEVIDQDNGIIPSIHPTPQGNASSLFGSLLIRRVAHIHVIVDGVGQIT